MYVLPAAALLQALCDTFIYVALVLLIFANIFSLIIFTLLQIVERREIKRVSALPNVGKVFKVIRKNKKPMTSAQIAKQIPEYSKSTIENYLYALQVDGIVKSTVEHGVKKYYTIKHLTY